MSNERDTITPGPVVITFVVLWRWKVSALWVIAVAAVVGLALGDILSAQKPSATGQTPFTTVAHLPLPSVGGRIDHLAFDATRRRLFIAALANDTVEVIDTERGVHLKSIQGFHEPQGLAVVPGLKGVAVANGDTGTLQLIDADSFETRWTTPIGSDADNVRYDGDSNRLYVAAEGGVAVVDPASGNVVQRIPISGHPESFQLEAGGNRLFANLPGTSQVVVADRTKMTVTARWPTTVCRSNYPMALDQATMRLFVGCRNPASVVSFDEATGKAVSSTPSVGDTDDLFYDAALKRLYVIGGEGFVDVVAIDGSSLRSVAHLPTGGGARTGLWVGEERRLYVAVPARGSAPAEVVVFEVKD